jgi:hypothetical protein
MYCHSLTAEKDGRLYDIPCENTTDGSLGVWLHELALEDAVLYDLLNGLREWAGPTGRTYEIYATLVTV